MLEAIIAKEPEYSRIIELDRSVRDYGRPALLDGDSTPMEIAPRFLCMQRALVSMGQELGGCKRLQPLLSIN